MKKPIVAVLAAAVVAAAAALAVPALAAGTTSVALKDAFFAPKSLTVQRGTTIRFRWVGLLPHNVTVRKGPQRFHTRIFTHGHVFSFRFTRSGSYLIVCTIHPGMQMNLRVR
jgi:plastocyanin